MADARKAAAAKEEEHQTQLQALADQTSGGFDEYNDASVHPPPSRLAGSHISSLAQYKEMHAQSLRDPAAFWGSLARSTLHWFRDFTEVCVTRGREDHERELQALAATKK